MQSMQRLAGLLVMSVVVIMLALAGNTIFRNAPLDSTWSLFLGSVIATVFGVPEVTKRLGDKRDEAAKRGEEESDGKPS